MIQVQSLTMRYGAFEALKGISFEVPERQILGLLGPNGAGKTTAMRILTTYLCPTSGTVKVNGLDILKQADQVRKLIGYLPETAPLYPDMTAEEYLTFVGQARGLQGRSIRERLEWTREACQIKTVWKHRLSELSKGYRQRVGLAQALIHDPKVLILDEPTSGLDPLQIIGIRELIRELSREKTILFSTHILSEVEAMAGKIVIINAGRLVAQGTPNELAEEVRGLGEIQPNPSLEDIFIGFLKPQAKRGEHV
ncbi:MAG: ABC transporter ATP-binding protein [Candidatus Omnitrophica bacterium]|nr:ABC transporter ATP-binding protein [Candidatus Omnitrophota bacterium]